MADFKQRIEAELENILKQAVQGKGHKLPQGQTWHRDLVQLALSENIISGPTAEALKQYLAFRHFFSHAYAFEVYAERIVPLVEGANKVFKKLLADFEILKFFP